MIRETAEDIVNTSLADGVPLFNLLSDKSEVSMPGLPFLGCSGRYPSHFRPVVMHWEHSGLTSSHLTRRILGLSAQILSMMLSRIDKHVKIYTSYLIFLF